MATTDSVLPGTSIPCQKPIVANRLADSSAVKAATRAGFGRSPWRSSGPGRVPSRAAAASSMRRNEVKRASVLPPAAPMSQPSSSAMASSAPGRRGSGRCRGT